VIALPKPAHDYALTNPEIDDLLGQLIEDRAASQSRADTGKDRGITEAGAGAAARPAGAALQHADRGGKARDGGAGDEREIQAPAAGRPDRTPVGGAFWSTVGRDIGTLLAHV
jgi:hypothetical protein